MRTIRFRGKTPFGEWRFGTVVIDNRKCGGYFIVGDKGLDCGINKEVLPETVGQFTGLTDKNGTEIYEGDILSSNGKLIGYVTGGVRGYCYDVNYITPLENGETSWPLYAIVTTDYPDKIEIAGNIYDNPELLKL